LPVEGSLIFLLTLIFPAHREAKMARNNGRTVYLRSDGQWANKANDALRASGFHRSLEDACVEATTMLKVAGGGVLTIRNPEGHVRNSHVDSSQTAERAH
jgi:hypothetical protein